MIVFRIEHPNGDGVWFKRDGTSRKAFIKDFIDNDIRGWLSCCKEYSYLRKYFSKTEWSKYSNKGCVISVYSAKDVKEYYDRSKNHAHLIFHPDTAKLIKQLKM
ncbi:hypothetical protein H1N69_gp15 [Lactococcus phage phiQ1]|uniref:Uncharacterized protein n=1 Tax=Lactococcus phage phiQ1 TaxID=2488571 RepID=A0A455VCV9_9CAUD|nr:hypothetical protein H1N69_gp15 [Lactococcus phage phiQ1]BBI90375.1 putative uncharacterized protein [Lactococcus phage phiQ1]